MNPTHKVWKSWAVEVLGVTEVKWGRLVPGSLFSLYYSVSPSIRKRCLAGTDSAGIHSLLTLLVGAEGKHTARVWLYESTARLAEAARLNSDDPHSGTIQSNKQKDSLLAEFMGHKPIEEPDSGAFLHRKAVKRKCLIGIETRAELIRSYKTALKTHGRLRGSTHRGLEAGALSILLQVGLRRGSWTEMTHVLWLSN